MVVLSPFCLIWILYQHHFRFLWCRAYTVGSSFNILISSNITQILLRKKQKKYLEGKIYQYSGESLEKEERVSVEDDFLDENRVLAPFVFN